MAFSEDSKLATLKQMMKTAVEEGTTWDEFKAAFDSMPEDFQDEVEALLGLEEDRAEEKITEWQDYKDNIAALKEEVMNP